MTEISTTVGSITGEVRLDLTLLARDIDQAKAKFRELEGENAAFEITADNRKALDAIDEVEERAEEIEAAPAKVQLEVDTRAAEVKLEAVRAEAAKPIVQDVIIRTEDMSGFQPGTVRPIESGASATTAMMATEQLTGANGDLVESYRAAEQAAVMATTAYSAEAEAALNIAVAKVRSANASKAATEAEKEYVLLLDDEAASATAVAAAEEAAVLARSKAVEASADLKRATDEVAVAEEVVATGAEDASQGLDKAAKSANGAEGRFQLLKLVILGLGPDLVPLAVGAVGITGALAGLGGAGVLAFLGIKREMADGTDAGMEYSSMLARLQTDAHTLETTAAGGLLSGANTAANELQDAMPVLNREVSTFSGELGQMLPTGMDAVVTLLERAEPLLDASGQYLVRMVQGLDGFSHSSEFESFIRTAVDDLPLVESTIDDTLNFVVRFLGAMGPYGNAVLTIVDDAAKLGSVLSPLAPGIWAMVTALTALKIGSAGLAVVQGMFSALGDTATVTAEEIGAVAVAEDIATDGVDLAPQAAAGAGGTAILAAAGIGLGVEGLSAGASQGAGKKGPTATASSVDTSYNGFGAGAPKSKSRGPNLGGGDTSYNGFGGGAEPPSDLAPKLLTIAEAYRQVADAAAKAHDKQETNAKSAQSLEGTYDAAADSLRTLRSDMAKNTTTLQQDTAAGDKNREAILGRIQLAQEHADAINSDGKHTAEATVYTDKYAVSLEKSLVAMGMSKSKAEEYIKTLLGIPKGTTLEVALKDAKAEAYLESIKSRLNNLNGTTAQVYVEAIASGVSTGRAAQIAKNAGLADGGTAGAIHAATGTTVYGSGTTASDSIPAMLSLGEEVVSNKYGQASWSRPVLKAISGQQVRSMDDLAAMLGGGRRGNVTTKHVDVGGVHIHNPVAKDPVQSAEDSSQLIAAYADFPG